jgi:hypothetical protein
MRELAYVASEDCPRARYLRHLNSPHPIPATPVDDPPWESEDL